MKCLVLNASPRPKGIISQAVDAFVEGVGSSTGENPVVDVDSVEVINVRDLDCRPCRGCMFCRSHGDCCLPVDDAHRLAEKIRRCDILVVAAPVYWGNIPGTLKVLFDRMVYALMGESKLGIPKPLHKGKRAYIITACTTPFPFNVICGQSKGVVHALKEILGTAGFRICGKVVVPGTKGLSGLPEKSRNKAKRLGSRVFI